MTKRCETASAGIPAEAALYDIYKLFSGEIGDRTVFIFAGHALLAEPYDKDNRAYEGNKRKEYPPSALADVVQTPYAEAKARKEKGKIDNA